MLLRCSHAVFFRDDTPGMIGGGTEKVVRRRRGRGRGRGREDDSKSLFKGKTEVEKDYLSVSGRIDATSDWTQLGTEQLNSSREIIISTGSTRFFRYPKYKREKTKEREGKPLLSSILD